jgi:urease accessory protein
MRRIALGLGISALFLGTIGAAEAHTVGAHGAGLAQGFAHPLLGLDHLLAMVAVGAWAGQLGGRAVWSVPAAFMAMMAAGAGLAFAGVSFPAVELGIVGSLLVLGTLIAAAVRLPMAFGGALVGFFALFHGHAHGSEIPEAASGALYVLGFVAATALLHGIGVAACLYLQGSTRQWVVRAGGAGVATAGLLMLAL